MALNGDHYRQQTNQRLNNGDLSETCRKCGYTVPHKGKTCPAKGHIRISGINADRPLPTVQLEICLISPAGQTAIITTVPDSGSQASVGGIDLLGISNNELQRGNPGNLVAANGSSLSEIGRVRARIRLEQLEYIINITIFSDVNGLLLSWYDSIAKRIFPPKYPKPVPVNSVDNHSLGHRDRPSQQTIDDTKRALTSEFSNVFDVSDPLRAGGEKGDHPRDRTHKIRMFDVRKKTILKVGLLLTILA
ncbi:hypothetical protein DAPPUDRAFT_256219 [Daphnia pulex]|uniref:Uncharacterized protein n=1 Tax=Daphnia pulex TaxID=6669 RepID=E9HB65_DAPPU|nr:hypothetical protein DAPPUDRAFT_256219 [Daphnia pulex]|eukprot:EFX70998.1 hypothetical protein DAPPUDRAFT_256219 [Daphnia pulex]